MAIPSNVCVTDGQPIALAAHYAVRVTLNVHVKVPADCTDGNGSCILETDTASKLWLLADVTQTGPSIAFTAHGCRFTIPPVAYKTKDTPPTQLTPSDALVQAVPASTSMTMLTGANTCSGFALPPFALVIGARLGPNGLDPLPAYNKDKTPPIHLCDKLAGSSCLTSTDSDCLCDLDKDGKPGATVMASGVPALDVDEVYLALRTVVGLGATVYPQGTGQATPGQRFKGLVTGLDLAQSPVGCHITPMGGGAPSDCTDAQTNAVAQLNPKLTQSTNTSSTFVAVPVPDTEDCAKLLADDPVLFKNQ